MSKRNLYYQPPLGFGGGLGVKPPVAERKGLPLMSCASSVRGVYPPRTLNPFKRLSSLSQVEVDQKPYSEE